MASSSTRLRQLALAAIVTNVAIVVTGGLVRVTGSGLGCPDWPTCEGDRVIPSGSADAGWHQAVEFGNRLMTFLVLAVAVAVLVAALRARPRRPDVTRAAVALPLGVLAQAVLGGITVLTGLDPLIVAAHLLLSMVLIAIAVVLHHRVRRITTADSAAVGRGDVTEAVPDLRLRRLGVALGVLAAAVLVVGTLVTASGPHAGDPGTERLGLDIRDVARVHAGLVWATVATTVAVLVLARRRGAAEVAKVAAALLLVEVVQGGVGYLQYATGIPAALVTIHLLLASLFWVAVVETYLVSRLPVGVGASVAPRAPAPVG